MLAAAVPASAHEVRPGYLELHEGEPGTFEVVWKQPRRGALLLLLDPVLPEHCTETARLAPESLAGALVERWTVECGAADDDPDRIFHGETFAIAGLERTLTDVLLRMSFANGDSLTQLLRPEAPSVTVDREAAGNALPYFRLGVEHLVFGFDHILFVIGLLFYVRSPWRLVGVITSFTLAHSITLALSSLDVVRLSSAPVEAVIALSILFLAVELLRPEDQRSPITTTSPWLIAFAFGLLHGFGFAGALAEIGLPGAGDRNGLVPLQRRRRGRATPRRRRGARARGRRQAGRHRRAGTRPANADLRDRDHRGLLVRGAGGPDRGVNPGR